MEEQGVSRPHISGQPLKSHEHVVAGGPEERVRLVICHEQNVLISHPELVLQQVPDAARVVDAPIQRVG